MTFTDAFIGAFSGAVIAFDLDGTLVDSAPDLVGALNGLLAEHGLAPLALPEGRPLIGGGARKLVERGFAAAGAPLAGDVSDALFQRFIDLYRERIAEETRPFEGVEAVLDSLKAEGARLIVCTNKRTDLSVALLQAVGLIDRFDAVVGPDRVSARKPAPAHLLEAIALAGGDPARALMVGDSSADVNAAKAAGVPVVAVTFGYTDIPARELGAEAVIDRFAELPAIARRLLARPLAVRA